MLCWIRKYRIPYPFPKTLRIIILTRLSMYWYIIHHTSLLLMNTFRLFCFNADQNFRLHIEQMPYICKHIYTQPIRQDYKKMPNTFLNWEVTDIIFMPSVKCAFRVYFYFVFEVTYSVYFLLSNNHNSWRTEIFLISHYRYRSFWIYDLLHHDIHFPFGYL